MNNKYEQTISLIVNTCLLLLVQFTLQNGTVQNDQRRSFPSLDLCHRQTNDIIIEGRVLSAQDMSVLLHRHVQRGRLLTADVTFDLPSRLQQSEWSSIGLVGALTRCMFKVTKLCQLQMLQECRSFINLPLGVLRFSFRSVQ